MQQSSKVITKINIFDGCIIPICDQDDFNGHIFTITQSSLFDNLRPLWMQSGITTALIFLVRALPGSNWGETVSRMLFLKQ